MPRAAFLTSSRDRGVEEQRAQATAPWLYILLTVVLDLDVCRDMQCSIACLIGLLSPEANVRQ